MSPPIGATALVLKGFVIGVAIAMPVGPIAMLIIRRSLQQGFAAGAATGLGAASADGLYGAVAGFGLASVAHVLMAAQLPLRLAGGLALILIGLASFRPRHSAAAAATTAYGLPAAYLSALGLTLANPLTIISFAAVFAGLGVAETAGSYRAAAIFVAALFLGSALWQIVLCVTVALVRKRLAPGIMRWLDRASGLLLIGFGLFAWRALLD
jgi:threonine/homoserine/homoserine lactone efflux protein